MLFLTRASFTEQKTNYDVDLYI